jgi:hypothetical protein
MEQRQFKGRESPDPDGRRHEARGHHPGPYRRREARHLGHHRPRPPPRWQGAMPHPSCPGSEDGGSAPLPQWLTSYATRAVPNSGASLASSTRAGCDPTAARSTRSRGDGRAITNGCDFPRIPTSFAPHWLPLGGRRHRAAQDVGPAPAAARRRASLQGCWCARPRSRPAGPARLPRVTRAGVPLLEQQEGEGQTCCSCTDDQDGDLLLDHPVILAFRHEGK